MIFLIRTLKLDSQYWEEAGKKTATQAKEQLKCLPDSAGEFPICKQRRESNLRQTSPAVQNHYKEAIERVKVWILGLITNFFAN